MNSNNTISEALAKIENLIEHDVNEIIKIVNTNDTITIGETIKMNAFDNYLVINNDIKEGQNKKKIRGRKGIYVFKMIDEYNVEDKFNEFPYSAKQKNLKIRIFKKSEILYVGKSNTLIKRVHEHYSSSAGSPYSLKLGWDIRNKLKKSSIMIIFLLKKEYENLSNLLLPITEEMLHEKLKPLTGSPRI